MFLYDTFIMQARDNDVVSGLWLNCFGDAYASEMTASYGSTWDSDTFMAMYGNHCRVLNRKEFGSMGKFQITCLLSLKGGDLCFLTLSTSSNKHFELQREGSMVLFSRIVSANDRFFALAYRLSDSVLEYQKIGRDDNAERSESEKGMKELREDNANIAIYGIKGPEREKKAS